jgi:hypothetical protein
MKFGLRSYKRTCSVTASRSGEGVVRCVLLEVALFKASIGWSTHKNLSCTSEEPTGQMLCEKKLSLDQGHMFMQWTDITSLTAVGCKNNRTETATDYWLIYVCNTISTNYTLFQRSYEFWNDYIFVIFQILYFIFFVYCFAYIKLSLETHNGKVRSSAASENCYFPETLICHYGDIVNHLTWQPQISPCSLSERMYTHQQITKSRWVRRQY